MRPNIYRILDRAIEEGIECGWNGSHKHEDKPVSHHVKEQIHTAILGSIYEIFDYESHMFLMDLERPCLYTGEKRELRESQKRACDVIL